MVNIGRLFRGCNASGFGDWQLEDEWQPSFQRSLSWGVARSVKVSPATDVRRCPPLIYLESFAKRLSGTSVLLGSQNLCAESSDIGAFTGEVSGTYACGVLCKGMFGRTF